MELPVIVKDLNNMELRNSKTCVSISVTDDYIVRYNAVNRGGK